MVIGAGRVQRGAGLGLWPGLGVGESTRGGGGSAPEGKGWQYTGVERARGVEAMPASGAACQIWQLLPMGGVSDMVARPLVPRGATGTGL